jgi:hypothetical protein
MTVSGKRILVGNLALHEGKGRGNIRMSNFNGVSLLHLRQLRAIAQNLCTLAKLHRDNNNHVVADALYTRALSVAEQISGNDRDVLIARIRTEQQAAFDMLEKSPLEKVQKVGG